MALKLLTSYETEIDVTRGGYVSITQPDNTGTGETAAVYLTALQLPAVIRELQAMLDDRESWEFDEETAGRGTKPAT